MTQGDLEGGSGQEWRGVLVLILLPTCPALQLPCLKLARVPGSRQQSCPHRSAHRQHHSEHLRWRSHSPQRTPPPGLTLALLCHEGTEATSLSSRNEADLGGFGLAQTILLFKDLGVFLQVFFNLLKQKQVSQGLNVQRNTKDTIL